MSLQTVLLAIHSWVRWIILLVGIIALVKHLTGFLTSAAYDRASRGLAAAYAGLMDLNVLVGLIQIVAFWGRYSAIAGGFPLPQVEHLVTMILATGAAHMATAWRSLDGRQRYRNALLALVVSLILIVIGISTLTGNRWIFRGL
jgi:hypothetical protein